MRERIAASFRSKTLVLCGAWAALVVALAILTRAAGEGNAAPPVAPTPRKPAAAPPARLFAATEPAKNPEALGLVVDDRQVLGWIAGTRDHAGREVTVRVGKRTELAIVRPDNTFTWAYSVDAPTEALFRIDALEQKLTLHPRRALEPTVFFVVDRTAYRPGQPLRFAGFLRRIDERGEWAPIADTQVEVVIASDRKQTVVSKRKVTSDASGKIAGEYTFSKEDPIDGYTISIAGHRGTAAVTLGEQRKSKVRLKIDGAPADDKLALTFSAVDFLDQPVEGAKVKFTAQVVHDLEERPAAGTLVGDDFVYHDAASALPELSKVSDDALLLRAAGVEAMLSQRVPQVLAEISGEVAAPGSHEVDLRAEWRRGRHRLLIEAVLVDAHGREQRASRTIPLASPSRRIDLAISSPLQAADVPVEVTQSIEADSPVVSSTLVALRIAPAGFTPYYGYQLSGWNGDWYANANPYQIRSAAYPSRRWRRAYGGNTDDELVDAVPFHGGAARVTLDDPGAYRLVAVARLADGTSLFGEIGCAVRERDELPPLVLRLDRDTLRPGERLTGTIESRFADARVLLVIRDSSGVRSSQPLRLRDGRLPIDLALPRDLRWGAAVTVDYFETAETRHVAQALFHVTPEDRMITVTTTRRPEVAPGETVNLDIQVDREEPVDLVVSVYDQSLLGIAPDRSVDVRSFYLADDRIAAIQARDWLRRRLGDVTLAELGGGSGPLHARDLPALLAKAGVRASFAAYAWGYWRLENVEPGARLIDLIDSSRGEWRLVYAVLHDQLVLAETGPGMDAASIQFVPIGRGDFRARGDSAGWVSGNASFSASGQASWSFVPMVIAATDPVEGGVRRDFSDSAYWNATLRTDAHGRARVSFRVPDSLTNWQVVVTAVSRDLHVGQQRTSFRTTKPIMIWPMLPALFTEGDEVRVFALVHNRTAQTRKQRVSLEVVGGEVVGDAAIEVEVPALGHVPVYWRMRPGAPGFLDLTMRTSGDAGADASLKRLPVASAAAVQTITASGFAEGSRALELPDGIDPRTASLELTFAPSLAADMIDTLDYLVDYPYGCVEQTMSRFVPALRVSQILDKLGVEHADLRRKLPRVVDQGIKRLIELQQPDGGWGWNGTGETHEMMTPYALWGLLLARDAGYELPRVDALRHGMARLRRYIDQMGDAQTADRIYSIYVYAQGEKMEASWWSFIRRRLGDEQLSDYALALSLELAATRGEDELAKRLAAALRRRAVKGRGGSHWRTAGFSRWGDDPHEVTAAALKALVAHDADDPLIGEVLAWLAETKRGNRWNSTKDTAMILYAMSDWLAKTGRRQGSAAEIALSLDGGAARKISLRDDLVHKLSLPVSKRKTTISFPTGSHGVMMRAVLRYAKRGRDLAPVDEGVRVTRRYWLLGEGGARLRELKSGDTIPRGSYLASEITAEVTGEELSRYVLVEDPRPSSCEVIAIDDPRFRMPVATPYVLREERTSGVSYHHEQTWGKIVDVTVLHAELSGDFVVPPANVELMYRTATRGHSGTFSFQVAE